MRLTFAIRKIVCKVNMKEKLFLIYFFFPISQNGQKLNEIKSFLLFSVSNSNKAKKKN